MDNKEDLFFQVSVKGLYFNQENRLMMIKEPSGFWELPGGRIRKGENFVDCLKRECKEELGLECAISEDKPMFVWPAIDQEGRGRIMVCYKIDLSNLNFVPSEECVALDFFSVDEVRKLKIYSQLKPLVDLL